MSHFVTLVLVPNDSLDVKGTVESLLAPYNEEIAVAPYKTDCWCIGGIAHRAGTDAADRDVEDMDVLRTRYWALPDAERPTWEAWIHDWMAVADRVEQTHPLYQKPDPQCEDCHGFGQRLTTYNPNSQWDWWTIGGRWDGWLSRSNRIPAKTAASQGKVPFAIVTPDGQWHEKGRMGWWGMTSNEKEDEAWADEVQRLLLAHPDALAVTCDLHI